MTPKKCGHMDGKQVIPAVKMAEKIRAAVAARTRPDFVIIARTDARAVEGLEPALDRARLYREAGADALFIEAVVSDEEAAEAARAFPDVPLLFNWAEGGKTPPIGLDRLRELGYRIVIFPISTLLAATGGDAPGAGRDRPVRHPGRCPGRAAGVRGVPGLHRAARGAGGGAAVRLLRGRSRLLGALAGPVQPGPGFPAR